MSIYVASKSKMGPDWRDWRSAGIPIISTWIDECGKGQSVLPDLWTRCIQEAASAEVLVLVHHDGDVQKGALVEMGAALTSGAAVIWVGPDYLTAQRHPLVRHAHDVEEAMGMAMTIVAKNHAPASVPRRDCRGWTWRTNKIVDAIAKRAEGGDAVTGVRLRMVGKGNGVRSVYEPEVTLVFTTIVIPVTPEPK